MKLGLGLGLTAHRRAAAGESLGPDIVLGFADGWTDESEGGWDFLGPGQAGAGDLTTGAIRQDVALVEGATYRCQWAASTITVGDVRLNIGGTAGMSRDAANSWTEDIVAGASDWIKVEPGTSGMFRGAVEPSPIIQQVTP